MVLKLFNSYMPVWVKIRMCGQFWQGWSVVSILFTVCFKGVIVASAAPKKGDSSYPLTRDEKRIWTNLLLANMSQIYRCWGVNIRQTWQMLHLPSYLHLPECFSVCKCGIYHLCHIFTPHHLHVCDIVARSKFVQIHFFVQCLSPRIYNRRLLNCTDIYSRLCHVNTNTELLWSDPCGK